ncbi:MAG: ABC transporter substrate-binding protein [Peptostreptococcaceae bacterium]|nr:ABC transporter substrate-binding protein [Peptostreptococcaceae bacterium]
MKFKKLMTSLLVTTMALGAVGCSTKTEETEVAGTNNLEGTTLKVVAAYDAKDQIFGKFTEETGINVEFIDMSSGEVLSRIKAENGKPMADVWFGGGADSFMAAAEAGLLEGYKSAEAETVPDAYKDENGYWTGTSLVSVGFMVNEELLKEKGLEAPQTWEDLADPQYKGEIMMADPAISGTNYAMVSNLIQHMGEEKAWDYFAKLNENIPFLAKKGSEPANKVSLGEFAVGIVPLTGAYFNMESEYPVKVIYPQDCIPYVPAPVAVFENAENSEAAKVFVDWVLSEEGQSFIQEQDARFMVRPEVEPVEAIKNFPSENLVDLDIKKLGTDREAILNKWTENFGSN